MRYLRERYAVAIGFGGVLVTYLFATVCGAIKPADALIIDAAWTAFSFATGIVCLAAAYKLAGRERSAWRIIGTGCLLWFAGQCVWDYYELSLGHLPPFPHWMQVLYVLFPILLIVGLLTLPKPDGSRGFTIRRAGNLGLLICTMLIILFIVVTEPAAQSQRPPIYVFATVIHGALYAIAYVVALYLLWGYRWQAAHWPLIFIVAGLAIHSGGFFSDVHNTLADTYRAGGWPHFAYLMSFYGVACAAQEFVWRRLHEQRVELPVLLQRERRVEAILPAVVAVKMTAIIAWNIEWMSARVILMCLGVGVLFAIILGIREAAIRIQEHRLVIELNNSRDRLLTANAELTRSEQQVRTLNAELEQRVSERTAELQAAYRELESFSYAVAHDIKAPLRAINAFGSLLVDEHGAQLDEKARRYVERMRYGALHMAQLVDDLLAYARIERLELQSQAADAATLIDACIAEQRDEILKLGAQVTADTMPIILHVDNAALTQAIRNLLQNALKFSRHATPPRISIAIKRVAKGMQIVVADNGIGFDMQYHDRIFALFQRLHRPDEYAGTGIGLAIARKAIERMDGRLWAQSKPNEGATFFIELPVKAV